MSVDLTTLALTDNERHSEAWLKLRTHLEARLEAHRRKNDAMNLSPEETAALRGRIAELKNLLAAGESQD